MAQNSLAVDNHNVKTRRYYDNLTKKQRDALAELQSLDDVVFKAADKGGNIVIWPTVQYEREVFEQLRDKETYQKLDFDPTTSFSLKLQQILSKAHDLGIISKKMFDGLMVRFPRSPTLYLLPKIHKDAVNPPGRPIVSGIDGFCEPVCRFIDFYLRPSVESLPSYVKDTTDVLMRVDGISMESDLLFVTMDVESLYTCIRHEDGVRAARFFLGMSGRDPDLNELYNNVRKDRCQSFLEAQHILEQVKMIRELAVLLCILQLFHFTQPLELNMMPDAFDDQYLCCEDKMEKEMPKILEEERKYKQFDEMWKNATEIWNRDKRNLPSSFKNNNISIAGRSRDYYMQHFHFKALHFYLTRALQVLTRGCAKKFVTYRGSRQIYNVSSALRFGQFASSSLNKSIAERFGKESFFTISTCFGADIADLSVFEQQEILIPIAEKFRNIKHNGYSYTLESSGELCSYFNCAYLGGEKRKDPECNPGYGYGNEVLKETGEKMNKPICDSGTFLDCGSSSRLGLYGLILGVVIARLY
ncbi:uncharacterized protein LOC142290093 [Anomaloglossus baeobatrachus]|uniref:uncharacterized protein LOC142290093 n=1 Tax=Anomaloglossus baeobatrachus TaxID=238106 RepID=UPI003F5068E2